MRRFGFLGVLLAGALILVLSQHAYAAGGTLVKFDETIEELALSRNGGRTWITVHKGAKVFKLLELSGGNAMAFVSGPLVMTE